MSTIRVTRAGLALGAASALMYVDCVLVMLTVPQEMLTVPQEGAIRFFDSILHSRDVEPLSLRRGRPVWVAGVGVLEVFVFGWLLGAILAALYNLGSRPSGESCTTVDTRTAIGDHGHRDHGEPARAER